MIKTLQNTLKQDKERFTVPRSVQNIIPIRRIWPDGVFQFGSKYSKTLRFSDINYAIASEEDKTAMFLSYSELLNALDTGSTTKITINNKRLDRRNFEQEILIPPEGDDLDGGRICEWPRATAKSQWSTDSNHLPASYREMSEWNGTYFTRKAMTIGPNTEAVIKRILSSRKLEVQTYRMCQGVLSFTRKYSKQALEETCRQALELGKAHYTFIKNTIPVVAEDLGTSGYNTVANEERNKGAFVMDAESMDINRLLSRSQNLAQRKGKGGDK